MYKNLFAVPYFWEFIFVCMGYIFFCSNPFMKWTNVFLLIVMGYIVSILTLFLYIKRSTFRGGCPHLKKIIEGCLHAKKTNCRLDSFQNTRIRLRILKFGIKASIFAKEIHTPNFHPFINNYRWWWYGYY